MEAEKKRLQNQSKRKGRKNADVQKLQAELEKTKKLLKTKYVILFEIVSAPNFFLFLREKRKSSQRRSKAN